MATPVDESKIIRPFLPSLFHIASIEVAMSLSHDFDYSTLEKAFIEVQRENSTSSTEGGEGNQITYSKAKRNWRFIPAHLRMDVWKTLTGLQFSFAGWIWEHSDIEMNEIAIYIKSDGTIDRRKTAQHLVLNENIDIMKRFEVACNYCLEFSVKVLWAEMELYGKTEFLGTDEISLVNFWSNRMRYGSLLPWKQAVLKFIESLESPPVTLPRFSSFFTLVQPKERQKCLTYLHEIDDLRFCLYTMTREEEEKVMEIHTYKVLLLHALWPLQDLFLATADKMWKFIDVETFRKLINLFLGNLIERHPDYRQLFKAFWQRSPNHLKDNVNECPIMKGKIESFFNEMKRNMAIVTLPQKRKLL